jgi:hypothetical protein
MFDPLLLLGSFVRPQKSAAYCGLFCCAMKTKAPSLLGGRDLLHVEMQTMTHPNSASIAEKPHKVVAAIVVHVVPAARLPLYKRRM